jgi:hypothetical protein
MLGVDMHHKWCITDVYVGWCIDCKKMHGMNNIKYELKIITVESIKICICRGDHVSFELATMYL